MENFNSSQNKNTQESSQVSKSEVISIPTLYPGMAQHFQSPQSSPNEQPSEIGLTDNQKKFMQKMWSDEAMERRKTVERIGELVFTVLAIIGLLSLFGLSIWE